MIKGDDFVDDLGSNILIYSPWRSWSCFPLAPCDTVWKIWVCFMVGFCGSAHPSWSFPSKAIQLSHVFCRLFCATGPRITRRFIWWTLCRRTGVCHLSLFAANARYKTHPNMSGRSKGQWFAVHWQCTDFRLINLPRAFSFNTGFPIPILKSKHIKSKHV